MKENFFLSQVFDKVKSQSRDIAVKESFSIGGVTNKSFFLLSLMSLGIVFAWNLVRSGGYSQGGVIFSSFVTIILVMVSLSRPDLGFIIVPIVALFEGFFVGSVSILFEALYPGVVLEAITITGATFFGLLFAYKTSLVEVNDKFRSVVTCAVLGIFCFYMLNLFLSFFGIVLYSTFSSSLFDIALNLMIAVVAALNLVINFDFIYQSKESGLPKYLEWNASLGLMIALVWMYLEIIHLLARLRSR